MVVLVDPVRAVSGKHGGGRADRAAGRKIACPVNVLWGEFGVVNRCFKPLEDWRRVADDVHGRTPPCGHYIPEEVPEELPQEMKVFFYIA